MGTKGPDLDMSPADTAQELAKARARIAELESRQAPALAGSFTSNTEIDAGENDRGLQEWFYKIDLPPSGGSDIRFNGVPYYHGEQYKVDTDTLRSLKDVVARCWKHNDDINGNNEDFYRKQTNKTLRGNGR